MRHLKAGRKLGRNASHRHALMRNLARALFEHGRIITTVEKAKELRPFAEKLITLAKKGTLHARRLAVARLHDKEMVTKLFKEIAPRFADRPGGYTRVIKRHERRLGDGGRTAFIELLKEGETKVRAKAPAPAPRITEPSPQPPAPAPEPAPTPEASATPPAAPESSAAPAPPTEGTPPTPPAGNPPPA
jgi:large subunit ribosomal protein L17